MLQITIIDTTGRQPVTLARLTASSAQVSDGALSISIPTEAQQTIARMKLTQHGVRYVSDQASEITVDLTSTSLTFDIGAA